jgi:hypothetical protein
MAQGLPPLTSEDAFHFVVRILRKPPNFIYPNFGYDVYLSDSQTRRPGWHL